MQKWGVLTIDLKKIPASSSLRKDGEGNTAAGVENLVLLGTALELQSGKSRITVYRYDVQTDTLAPVEVTQEDFQLGGEIYWSHPSLATVRRLLLKLEGLAA